jgi:hypothetical protein
MNDDFLVSLKREPSATFSARLLGRLSESENVRSSQRASRRLRVGLQAVAAAIVVAAVFTIPGVRASAQSFLALFRADRFLAVPVDSRRVSDLSRRIDLERLLGGQVNVIQEPGQPVVLPGPEQASDAAGYGVRLPGHLPSGASLSRTEVTGASVVEVTASTSSLRLVMDALSINDLEVPAGLDGQVVRLDVSPVVSVQYTGGNTSFQILQALAPVVALPAGVDVAALGEIALRVLGLGAVDAHQIAQSIDWHTTLLVPIPASDASFRQVAVGDANGLLVEKREDLPFRSRMLLWSSGGRAYAMTTRGDITADELLEIASSIP